MKIKFKDGIVIEVSDTEGKNTKEIVAEAKEIHKEFVKDAKLRRTFYTNTAFSATEIKEAIAEGDWRKLDKELKLLDRDIDTDIRRNQNYTERYSKDQLKKIIKAYADVAAQLRRMTVDSDIWTAKANEIDAKINTLKENWSINDSKTVKDSLIRIKNEEDGCWYIVDEDTYEEVDGPYDTLRATEDAGYGNLPYEAPRTDDSKTVKDESLECDWYYEGTDKDALKDAEKIAEKYSLTVKAVGRANGNLIMRFTGKKSDLKKLSEYYGYSDDEFNEFIEDSKTVKDVPPYYDPSVTVGETATNYSASRVEKADRYNDITMLEVEFDGIIQDLEEYIQDTTDFNDPDNILHTYRKDELRTITSKYYDLAKIYKKNGLTEQADAIKALTDTLYQRWHLGA